MLDIKYNGRKFLQLRHTLFRAPAESVNILKQLDHFIQLQMNVAHMVGYTYILGGLTSFLKLNCLRIVFSQQCIRNHVPHSRDMKVSNFERDFEIFYGKVIGLL